MAIFNASEIDVSIATAGRGSLAATLYRPAGAAVAAVVDVHGGAWTSGDRLMNVSIARHLAAAGIAVLSLEFRMPPDAAYPETVADIGAGIRWLKTHASDVGTDAAHVGILGTSSGGHLALLTALRPFDERYTGPIVHGEPDITVPFAALCWPVSDPVARYRMVRERANTKLIDAHHAFWTDEATMADGNPFAIVTRGDAQALPPLLILQGTNDDNLTPDMQQRFCAAYRTAGGRVELAIFPDQPHSFIGRDPAAPAAAAALAQLAAFIKHEADALQGLG